MNQIESNASAEPARPDVSIIVPCYFEEGHLAASVAEIDRVMKNTVWSHEIIFVEDGSGDGTADVIRKIVGEADNRRAVFHEKNMGRGAAVVSGVREARGVIAGFIDIDLEVHARYIPDAISYITDMGYDLVVGKRDYRIHFGPSSLARHALSSIYRRFCHRLLPIPVFDSEAGIKFFLRDRMLPILEKTQDKGWFWDTEMTVLSFMEGLKVGEFDCLFVRRMDKKSTVRVVRDTFRYLVSLMKFRRRIAKENPELMVRYHARRGNAGLEDYWKGEGAAFSSIYKSGALSPSFIVRKFLDSRSEKLLEYVPGGNAVLDIGCGGGENLLLLADRFARLYGVDISEAMISAAKENLASVSREKTVELKTASIDSIDYHDAMFDTVMVIGVLDYLDDLGGSMAVVRRLVKKGGVAIVTAPKKPSPFGFLRSGPGAYIKKHVFNLPPIPTVLSEKDLRDLCGRAGFTVEKLDSIWSTMWIAKLLAKD